RSSLLSGGGPEATAAVRVCSSSLRVDRVHAVDARRSAGARGGGRERRGDLALHARSAAGRRPVRCNGQRRDTRIPQTLGQRRGRRPQAARAARTDRRRRSPHRSPAPAHTSRHSGRASLACARPPCTVPGRVLTVAVESGLAPERDVFLSYHAVLVFLITGVAMVCTPLILGMLFRPKNSYPAKTMPYECAEDPIGPAQVRFDMRFYTAALIFIVFDV